MKKINKNLYLVLLFILAIGATYFFTNKADKKVYEQPEIESIIVFGEEVKVNPKKRVYRITMDSAEIKYQGGGCSPIPVIVNFKDGEGITGGISTNYDGTEMVYGFYDVNKHNKKGEVIDSDENIEQTSKKIESVENFDAYVEVHFNQPLKIDEQCRPNSSQKEE